MPVSKLKCSKCGNPLGRSDPRTQSNTCINCGKVIRGTHEIHNFIQANRKEIAKDYKEYGLSKTLNTWRISATALYKIPEVREVKGIYRTEYHIRHIKESEGEINTKTKEQGNGHLPQLPIFSNDWESEVQLKWLSLYEIILTKKED